MVILSTLVAALPFMAAAVLATVNYPTIPADLTTPTQQRIAVIGPGAMSIGWNTYEKIANPCVQYGSSATSLTHQECSTSSATYPTSRTYSNSVTITGLQPATTYYYKIVSTNSSVDHFLSPRTAGDTTPFNMNVVIDMGVFGENGYSLKGDTSKRDTIPSIPASMAHTTIAALANTVSDYEFVIHPGDFAYADDWFDTSSNVGEEQDAFEAILENFYYQLAPVAAQKAYMASPGNHEADCEEEDFDNTVCPTGQKNFTDFMNRFGRTMPYAFPSSSQVNSAKANSYRASALANPPFWYSFEYGMVHITMFDTETDFPDAPDAPGGTQDLNSGPFGSYPNQQTDFLKADLASVDRTVTPWLIVAGHRPWYSTNPSSNSCGPCQAAFESIFYEYGVDLAIFGHVHNSQRFLPQYKGIADVNKYNNPMAPMYIVAGGAGNIEGLTSIGTNVSNNQFAYASDYSYATVKFLDMQHLEIDFIQSSTGDILDTSVLYKQHNVQFVTQAP